jgi:hypothetical protein
VTGLIPELWHALRDARTIRIETSAGPERPRHEATIWVVVDDRGRILVRSWRGERGRWFRELRSNPSGRLRVGDRWVHIRADLAADPERVEACSEGLREKYATARGSLAQMLVDDVLPATLELHPA